MLGRLFKSEAALRDSLAASWQGYGCFHLVDSNGDAALIRYDASGCPYNESEARDRLAWLAGEALRTGAPQRQAHGQRQLLALPVRTLSGVAGVCAACLADERGRAQLEAQAALLAAVVSREQELQSMTAELADTYDQLVSLYGVSDQVRQDTDLTDLLRRVMEQAARLVGANHALVVAEQPAGAAACHVYPENWLGNVLAPTVQRLVTANGAAIVINDAAECASALGSQQIRSMLATPLYAHGQIIGALALFDKPQDAGFSAGNQKLLTSLAANVESYLERASLQGQLVEQQHLQHELQLAAQIQSSLMNTEKPQLAGVDLTAHCRPALQVGGDFYDLVSENGLTITVGDVASHGLSAALLMPMVRTTMREAVAQHVLPGWALAEVNRRLYQDLSNVGLFVTALIATYRPEDRVLTIANAGHTETLLWRGSQSEAAWLMADCPPLGVLPDVMVEGRQFQLESGDLVVAYSDGLTEAADQRERMFGKERLLDVVREHADASADQIAQALFAAVNAHEQTQNDDQTVVILKLDHRSPS